MSEVRELETQRALYKSARQLVKPEWCSKRFLTAWIPIKHLSKINFRKNASTTVPLL